LAALSIIEIASAAMGPEKRSPAQISRLGNFAAHASKSPNLQRKFAD
jgi:hypothetical protein